ncbi:MAG: phosphocholine-specific phospholipase C [Mucilaginibacter sp.]
MDSRRAFIKKAALLTGAASLSGILPASIQKALAINPAPGSTYLDAEHIVILMQENRSFDHAFGNLRGVRGYNDPRAITLPNKNLVWLQSNNQGQTYAPFHLDIKNTRSTWMSSLPHTWANQVSARNDGKFDKWLESKRSSNQAYKDMPLTLGYHNRQDLPFYYALADAFTICDQYFCSSLTGTGPNRLFHWTGTIRAEQDENSRALVWNDDADFGDLKWTTFPERLEDHGISWKCYQNEVGIDVGLNDDESQWLSNFTDNELEYFAQYNIKLYKKHVDWLQKQAADLPTKIAGLQQQHAQTTGAASLRLKAQLKDAQKQLDDVNKQLANIHPGDFDRLTERSKNLHNKAFSSNEIDPHYHELTTLAYNDNGHHREMQVPKGDVLAQFRKDVMTGNLPMVSWITAPENFSDHPSAPWYGAWYVSEVMDILTHNPEVWKKTIFILNYDENDGYFDHIPPFVAPHSHKADTGKASKGIDTRVDYVTLAQERERNNFPEPDNAESPIGLGYRVPMIVASPWSRGGWVNSEVFDHTSSLQFLEHFIHEKTGKRITETNISPWRRTICGNLTSIFRPYRGEKIQQPAFLNRNTFVEGINKAQFKKLPSDFKALSPAEISQFNHAPYLSPYMPQQEPGIKPSNALPYQLYADGNLAADKKTFRINFQAANTLFGKLAVGAPFNVYAPDKFKGEAVHTWAYAVTAGDTVPDQWHLHDFDNKNYHLRVYGPNGFFREYTGNNADPDITIACEYQVKTSGNSAWGNIELKVTNWSDKNNYHVQITDNAYRTNNLSKMINHSSDSSIILNLNNSHNWYDFTVRITGAVNFMKRYAGRVETGRPSHSDPFMGRVS